MTARLAFLVWAGAGLAAGPTHAGTITGIGITGAGVNSWAAGVSADGAVVVGTGSTSFQAKYAWRWHAATGTQVLDTYQSQTEVNGISADGVVMYGRAYDPAISNWSAVRWTGLGPGTIQSLGLLPSTTSGTAFGASANGGIVIGNNFGATNSRAFRWVALQGIQDLYALSGLTALAISRDGATYVGTVPLGNGYYGAGRWSQATGLQTIFTNSYPFDSGAYGTLVSADGSVVVGYTDVSVAGEYFASAVRWTAATGAIGVGHMTNPSGINGDASIIVGYYYQQIYPDPLVWYASLWTPVLGGVNLNEYLAARGVNLAGWDLHRAAGVSDDGRVIVGLGTHFVNNTWRDEGFIVTLDTGVPMCYANCDASTAPPVLNVGDFVCFLNRFAANDYGYANCDGSSAQPVLNVNDFLCYMNRFSAGCVRP